MHERNNVCCECHVAFDLLKQKASHFDTIRNFYYFIISCDVLVFTCDVKIILNTYLSILWFNLF